MQWIQRLVEKPVQVEHVRAASGEQAADHAQAGLVDLFQITRGGGPFDDLSTPIFQLTTAKYAHNVSFDETTFKPVSAPRARLPSARRRSSSRK